MKKIIIGMLIMTMILLTVGCSDNNTTSKPAGNTAANTVQSVLEQQITAADEQQVPDEQKAPIEQEASIAIPDNTSQIVTEQSEVQPDSNPPEDEDEAYDVDLTKLSSTMIYSEVYNMMVEPDLYIGKSIRMNGRFALYQATDEEGVPIPEQIYFACIIADATACCSRGLEFVLAGEYTYPDDYPEIGTEITVSGTFDIYFEDGYMYCHLINAVLE